MQSPTVSTKRSLPAIISSCALHAALFACVVLLGTRPRLKVIDPGQPQAVAQIAMAGGSHAVKLRLPATDMSAHTRHPAPNLEPTKKTILPVEKSPQAKSGGGAPLAPHSGDGSGKAERGNGSDDLDARPAFPIFSPHPPVADRSLLPSTEKKIVVDVSVDVLGAVVSAKLVKGLGNKLDQIALDTVKTWRFQPATINGKPVPTEAEVIFPFNLNYPISAS